MPFRENRCAGSEKKFRESTMKRILFSASIWSGLGEFDAFWEKVASFIIL